VKNLESGLTKAWDHFLTGKEPETIEVIESSDAAKGSYDDLITSTPSDRVAHDEL
jgi:hypothetical protein